MNGSGVLALSVILGLAILIPIVALSARSSRRSTADWVVAQLQSADDRVVLRPTSLDHVWNPSKPPGVDSWLMGPGRATYSREDGPEGAIIHLEFVRKGETTAEHHRGPIPASAVAGTAANRASHQGHRTAWGMTIARVVILLVSVAVAIAVSAPGRRLQRSPRE